MLRLDTKDFNLLINLLLCVERSINLDIDNISSKSALPVAVHFIPGWGKKNYIRAPTFKEEEQQREANEEKENTHKKLLIKFQEIKNIYRLRSNTGKEYTVSTEKDLENIVMVIEEYEYSKIKTTLSGAQELRLSTLYDYVLKNLE